MLNPEDIESVRDAIRSCAQADERVLEALCREVRVLKPGVRVIRPRTTTAVSLVASDGGNNRLEFDPFLFQMVRVVDSCGKQLCLDVISPTTDTDALSRRQFDEQHRPVTDLGFLMEELGVRTHHLHDLSPMIPWGAKVREQPEKVGTSWVQVYRDLVEWAVLYRLIVDRRFGTDTLIVRDGLLRSKVFAGDLFIKMMQRIEQAIERVRTEDKRNVYLVGVAKHSKVLQRYQLAMALEDVLPGGEARFVEIPADLEAKAYKWDEWARGRTEAEEGGEAAKFKAGQMYFVRFGSRVSDPVWTIDLLESQTDRAQEVFGYLLADAINGFPVPYYPRCLQSAHEHAQVAGFDSAILQHEVLEAIRDLLPDQRRPILDRAQLDAGDISERRYG
ncbi:hypothetical protein MX659_07705 [Coriobacteriia bacterium Es71-Z0120]|uniref:hypothetical protein n=1 Tax=Parvivirga hydrogeniphila TaxID=2939460 RepID=UPI002260A6C5|nr:hypothetical protein [Parvivirga hydrogeniphila]MCL4079467.1 hypothetical protein [Parvivirga hydrogeniphila]